MRACCSPLHLDLNPTICSATLCTRAAPTDPTGYGDDDDFLANIPEEQMVAVSQPPPHAPPPHAPPPPQNHAASAAYVAQLEAQLAEAKKKLAESAPLQPYAPNPPHAHNPPHAPTPSHAPNPPHPPSAPLPGVPAGGPSVRAARKLSTKRPLAAGEGADARATKQHTVDLT